MKTPQEWSDDRWDQFSNKVTLTQWIELIQKDAYDSGRVGGRSFELYRVAQILRDSGDPKMEAMANSCERLASMIIQSKDTPCSKNTP